MSISKTFTTDTYALREAYAQIHEDAAMYQAMAMPSLGFSQKDFGRNPKKSITGGTFDVTSIGTSHTAENEEKLKNDRKRTSRIQNKRNRRHKSSIRRPR